MALAFAEYVAPIAYDMDVELDEDPQPISCHPDRVGDCVDNGKVVFMPYHLVKLVIDPLVPPLAFRVTVYDASAGTVTLDITGLLSEL